MKTAGEKHNNVCADVDWDLITPPEFYLSEKAAKRKRKLLNKIRVREYKRSARRFAKSITRIFWKDL